ELVTVEFEEERERAKDMLVLTVIATVFFSFALIVLSTLVVFLFWETHPVMALVSVMLVYAVIGAVAVLMLQRRRVTRPFAVTRAEREKDVEPLRARSGAAASTRWPSARCCWSPGCSCSAWK